MLRSIVKRNVHWGIFLRSPIFETSSNTHVSTLIGIWRTSSRFVGQKVGTPLRVLAPDYVYASFCGPCNIPSFNNKVNSVRMTLLEKYVYDHEPLDQKLAPTDLH